jgi:hypothetical protein
MIRSLITYAQNGIRVNKASRMRTAWYVARMGVKRNAYKTYTRGNLKGRDHLGDLEVDRRIILK